MIIQSNKARLYKNTIVPFLIHMISKSTGIFAYQYIHIEIGSGKYMIDGKFAMMTNIVRAYVDVVFNICTPLQLVCAPN